MHDVKTAKNNVFKIVSFSLSKFLTFNLHIRRYGYDWTLPALTDRSMNIPILQQQLEQENSLTRNITCRREVHLDHQGTSDLRLHC